MERDPKSALPSTFFCCCFVFSYWTPIMRSTSNILVPLWEHQFYLSRWKSPLQKVQVSSSPHCLQEAASKHSGELVSEPAELQACESLRQKRNSDNFRGAEKPIWKTLFLDRRTDQIFLLHCTKNRPECMILVHSYSRHDSKKSHSENFSQISLCEDIEESKRPTENKKREKGNYEHSEKDWLCLWKVSEQHTQKPSTDERCLITN